MKLKRTIELLSFFMVFGVLASCQKEEVTNLRPNNPVTVNEPNPVTIHIDLNAKYQTIAGFGGANRMWGTQFLKPAEAEKAFSTDDSGLGLSIFRVRIASNSAEWSNMLESCKEAQKYGVKILASPWSPPAALKSNGQDIGGRLPSDNYEAFKDHINSFVKFMSDNGVDIYAISIQNEPDIQVGYESCDWTASEMANFLKTYGDQIVGTKVAAPESYNFNQDFTNTLLTDDSVTDNFDIVAGHIYGGGLAPFPMAEAKNKEVWMTEYLLNLNTGNSGATPWADYTESQIWDETLTMLNTIHEAMLHNWNAYVWWYSQRYYSFIGDGDQGTTNGEILKRGYAFSHFSKFVRPGASRVEASASRSSDLKLTAYDSDDQTVLVLINTTATAANNIQVAFPKVLSAKAYETSVNANRQEKEIDILDDDIVKVGSIPAKSIVTVIAKK